jgi:AcrR family transcriptional regulator
MPKRDAAYMENQRELIAQAALDVMLEKGVYGTSLRDICQQAGCSIGALYIHFKTKEEVMVAAFALDNVTRYDRPAAESWAEYEESARHVRDFMDNPRELRRSRLSLQFVADMALASENPPGLTQIYVDHVLGIRESLKRIHAAGEIILPMGLDQTVALHSSMFMGTQYMIMSNRDLDIKAMVEGLVQGLALTAGFVAKG